MKKGFTLLELLIVIGIIAVLASVVTVVLNPLELLRQARDSSRASDLASLNSALGLYLTSVTTGMSLGTTTNCNASSAVVLATCTARHAGKTAMNSSVTRLTDGTGWIPVNIGAISGGSPLASLPVDPTNDITSLFYSYSNTASTYELNATFESIKYLTDMDLDGKDGGSSITIYEIGTEPGLDI